MIVYSYSYHAKLQRWFSWIVFKHRAYINDYIQQKTMYIITYLHRNPTPVMWVKWALLYCPHHQVSLDLTQSNIIYFERKRAAWIIEVWNKNPINSLFNSMHPHRITATFTTIPSGFNDGIGNRRYSNTVEKLYIFCKKNPVKSVKYAWIQHNITV